MVRCCVCKYTIRKGRLVFEESIGKPPVQIAELLIKCTGIRTLRSDSEICKTCFDKLFRFYNSILLAKQMKQELMDIMRKRQSKDEVESDIKIESDSRTKKLEINDESHQEIFVEQVEFADEMAIEYNCDNDELEEEFYLEDEIMDGEEFKHTTRSQQNNSNSDHDSDLSALDIMGEQNSSQVISKKEYCRSARGNKKNVYSNVGMFERQASKKILKKEYPDSDHDSDLSALDLLGEQSRMQAKDRIQCSECDQTFANEKKYDVHIRKEHFKGYMCDQCGKTLYSKSGFLRHVENHNPENALTCAVCGHCFKNKFSLKHHMAWHSGDKPHQCDICQKQFVHRIALKKHKLIHDNQTRRVECAECGFKFRTKAHLQRHMMTHTGVKPYSCPVCGKCFAQAYNMKVHVQEHEMPGSTRQRRLKCKKCTRTFTNPENYREHCEREDCEAART